MAINTVNCNGFNILGNNTSPDQFGHFMRKVFNGNVAGLAVTQNTTPNMTVRVDEGVAILTKNTTSSVWGEVKTTTNVTIQTADTANPRIDTIIIYEDTSVALPTAKPYLTDGGGGRFKLASVSGTAAASPVTTSDSSIQSQIGAGKPWARIADVTVPANTTTIINSNIADKRSYIGIGLNQLNGGTTAGVLKTDATGNVTATAEQAWQTPTLTNSWVNFSGSYETAGYMKDSLGFVHFKGLVKSGAPSQSIFTLPAGYRPLKTRYISTVGGGSVATIDIDASGAVVPNGIGITSSCSLECITFRAEA